MDSKPYLTLSQPTEYEIEPIKGSRFIGFAAPIDNDDAALTLVEQIKTRYPDARHWCWAYQLRAQKRTRFNDDGEPSGSAGKPILAPIVGRELMDAIVVVVRYFGGVKLGVGGLVRAYSHCANAVLDNAEIVNIAPKQIVHLDYCYDDTGQVAGALAGLGLQEVHTRYTDRVTAELHVVPDVVAQVITTLTNATAGRIVITVDD